LLKESCAQREPEGSSGGVKIENSMVASSAGRHWFSGVIKAFDAGNNAVPIGIQRKPADLRGVLTSLRIRNKVGRLIKLDNELNKDTQRSPDRIDWDIRAADALERARLLPPGPERNEALKRASLLRCSADSRGLTFAKRGRPSK
jgi:hypothetical protein